VTDAGFDADDLVKRAWQARDGAYAPYSRFRVGAALATDAGVFTGANVENAAYPTGVCAERVAGGTAVAAGARRFLAVAVVAGTADPITPCGQCRQFLREFGRDMAVVAEAPDGTRREWLLARLLPDSFGPEVLEEAPPDAG
jgi:cytidine deaminase